MATTICLITKDNYMLTRLSIENLLKHCGDIKHKLFIIDNNSSDKRIINFGKYISDFHMENKVTSTNSYCYNQLLERVSSDFICIFPSGTLVNENWLKDLRSKHQNITDSGIVTISNFGDKGSLTNLIDNQDKMKFVYSNVNGETHGVIFFNYSLIEAIGGFDIKKENEELAQRQLSFRCNRAYRKCYYLTNQFAFDLFDRKNLNSNENLITFKNEIEEFRKGKNLKLEL